MNTYRKKKVIRRSIMFPQLKYPLNFAKYADMKKTIVNEKTSSLHYLMLKCNKSKNELVEWMYEIQKQNKSEIILSSKQIAEIKYRKNIKKQRSKSTTNINDACPNKKKEDKKSVNDYSELEKLQIKLKDIEYLNQCKLKLNENGYDNKFNRSIEERNDTFRNIKKGNYYSSFGKAIFVGINPLIKQYN